MLVRAKKVIFSVVLFLILATGLPADQAQYSGDIVSMDFTVPGGQGVRTFSLTIDTNESGLVLGNLDFRIHHSAAVPAPFLIGFGDTSYTWLLEDNGNNDSSGVNVDLSNSVDIDGSILVTLLLTANDPDAIPPGEFTNTFTWIFYITDTTATSHSYDVSTGVTGGSVNFPEIRVTQGGVDLFDGTGVKDFGTVGVGGSSGVLDFTITNLDLGNLTIGTIALSGTNPGDFNLDQSSLTTPVPMPTGTTFSISFDPLALGSKSAIVTIPNNDVFEAEYTFEIRGDGIVPPTPDINVLQGGAAIPGGDYDFGDVVADGDGLVTSGAVAFSVENTGSAPLEVTDISFSAGDSTHFDLTASAMPFTVDATPVDFTIEFDPLSINGKSATVSIVSDDGDESPYTFTVSGNGTDVPTPEIELFKGMVSIAVGENGHVFGDVLADGAGGDDDGSITFTIENIGEAALTISAVTPTVGDMDDFVVSTTGMSSSVSAGDSTTFTITFDPLSPGPKAATVTIANNDGDEAAYHFAVTGNGLPVDKVFFPPTYPLPWELEPTIDGVVDDHPGGIAQNEVGWNNAFRLTYDNGSEPQMAFQGLRQNSVSPDYLLLSFEVKNDLHFEDEDLIILTFRPDQDPDADQSNDLRIFVFPVHTGIGAKDPGGADMGVENNPDLPKHDRPVREFRFYQKQSPAWNWDEIHDVDAGDFDFKVYSYPEGSTPLGDNMYSWDVEMKIPTSISRGGIPWISLEENFLFFFDVVRVNADFGPTDEGYATQYTWPRNLPEQPYGDLESTYAFPYIFWGDAGLNNSGQVKGVWIERSGIGVLDDPCQTTAIGAGDISRYFKIGTFSGSGELLTRAHNRIVATVKNNTERVESVAGSPVELQPVEAENIRVRFRLAHWGATLGEEGDWIVVEGLDEGDAADPPFPSAPAACAGTFAFKTARDNEGWLVPDQTVSAASGPFQPGEEYFFYDFVLSGDETTGDVQRYKSVQDHQCIYVEIDSLGSADILTRSTWRNMDFVDASLYSDTARISTRGCGDPPAGSDTHRVILQTRERTWIREKPSKDPQADNRRPAASKSMIATDWLAVPNPFPSPPAAVDSYLEYIVDAYYDTGESVIINDKTFLLYKPIGSFGYVAHHDGPVEEWRAELTADGAVGLELTDGGVYTLRIAPDSHVNIQPVIRSIAPAKYAVSLHGGLSLPLTGFTGAYDYGINTAVDFDISLWPWLSIAAIGGVNYFWDKDGAVDPQYIITAAASLRVHRALGALFSLYGGAGPEWVFIRNTGGQTDLLAEVGLDFKASRSITLEVGGRFHGLIDSSVRFLTLDLGMLFRF